MKYLDLKQIDNIYVVTMINSAEANALNYDVAKEHLEVLEQLEQKRGNGAVVLTSSDPKSWCTGINLEWMKTQVNFDLPKFLKYLDQVFLRWSLLNLPTVACINGHAFAGGAILAACMDYRYMREDRGWYCYSEVDVKIAFTEVMYAIIKNEIPYNAMRDLTFTGRRVGGKEAVALGIAHETKALDDLFPRALEMAQFLAQKDRATYAALKHGMRNNLTAMLRE